MSQFIKSKLERLILLLYLLVLCEYSYHTSIVYIFVYHAYNPNSSVYNRDVGDMSMEIMRLEQLSSHMTLKKEPTQFLTHRLLYHHSPSSKKYRHIFLSMKGFVTQEAV